MIIDIYLNKYKEIIQSSKNIGKTYENRSTILRFNLLDDMVDKDLYLDIELPDGTKYKSTALIISNNKATFEITNSMLEEIGILKVEPILQTNDSYVMKFPTLEFNIIDSINAIQSIQDENPDFTSQCQAIIDLIDFDGDGSRFLSNDGTYKVISSGTTDYNDLSNKPIVKLESMDYEHPTILRNLESGVYVLYGYILPYEGSVDLFAAQVPISVNIARYDDMSFAQLFFAFNNQLQYFEITNDSYTFKEVLFNNLITRIEALESRLP